jgi:phosphatidylserine/phosphatidylglycerophosphate/cardiolipin synthase-like enzyme
MEELLDAIAAIVGLVSPEKVKAIATRIRNTDPTKAATALSGVLGTPMGSIVVERLVEAWRGTTIKADELASMLLASSYVIGKAAREQSTELVWTGPTTPFVSARRTEQALLQVIASARSTLFITSFVAYDISSIVAAFNAASGRGVSISMLLESSHEHGGSIGLDVIGKMRNLVPAARLYRWLNKPDEFADGRVHAKVAVADSKVCFITSANLTGYAMERNMEAGILVSGGPIPRALDEHLRALVNIGVVSPA